MDFLKPVIDFISFEYDRLSRKWNNDINLKNNTVRTLYETNQIYDLIGSYLDFINFPSVRVINEFTDIGLSCGVVPEGRIKQFNSVQGKVHTYLEKENGGIPMNKCFNDLMGLRVIIETEDTIDKIRSDFSKLYPDLKCINSSKNGYNAVHVYFKLEKDNTKFQWELQIWRKSDEKANRDSHMKYKQEYTSWEKDFFSHS